MYLPQHFEETRLQVLHELIRAYPLATLVTPGATELQVNHIPMLLDPGAGSYGTLRAHVARANPVWRELPGQQASVAVFQGPDSYISPSWYPAKQVHGKVVPTWNYAVVQAYGQPRVIDDTEWLLALVSALTEQHEAGLAAPWQVSDAPADFVQNMLQAIVGIEIPISKISGKWKVSQNRPQADRHGVVAGLESQDSERHRAMAALVKQNDF
ncbi:MAG: FMN-binding negative transcriptional regulator [Gammaproteobacteria bacterium]